jgi:hypothetical protein
VTIVVPVVSDDTELLMLKLPELTLGTALFKLANPPVTGLFCGKCFSRLLSDNREKFFDALVVGIPCFDVVFALVYQFCPLPCDFAMSAAPMVRGAGLAPARTGHMRGLAAVIQ